jgi:exonuclease SbcD
MKILHTSDLHLGDIWRGQQRWGDQMRVLDELLRLCDEHDVDMLLVAGDVFSDRVHARHETVAREFLERLRPHLQRGRAVFLLRGNHDPYALFQLMGLLVQEMAGGDRWPLVIASVPSIYTVPGHDLQVIALPYVWPGWLRSEAFDAEQDPEERVAGLAGLLGQRLDRLCRQADPDVPAIFTAHFTVRGTELAPNIQAESGYHREMLLDPARLPQNTSYNALGHIHLAQPIAGAGKPTWYSGAPDRVDLGERDYTPRAILVETPDTPGGEATIRHLWLESPTPFVRAEAHGHEEVAAFCQQVRGKDPLGEVTLSGIAAAERPAVQALIHEAAPRLQLFWRRLDEPERVPEEDRADPTDVPHFVRAYLAKAYERQPELRARLEAAFDTLWTEQSEALA